MLVDYKMDEKKKIDGMWNKYIFSLEVRIIIYANEKIKEHVIFDQIYYIALSIKKIK